MRNEWLYKVNCQMTLRTEPRMRGPFSRPRQNQSKCFLHPVITDFNHPQTSPIIVDHTILVLLFSTRANHLSIQLMLSQAAPFKNSSPFHRYRLSVSKWTFNTGPSTANMAVFPAVFPNLQMHWLIGVLVILVLAVVVVRRLYFNPLSKFPGPKLAAATILYEAYYDVIKHGQYTFKIKELHKKYGGWFNALSQCV